MYGIGFNFKTQVFVMRLLIITQKCNAVHSRHEKSIVAFQIVKCFRIIKCAQFSSRIKCVAHVRTTVCIPGIKGNKSFIFRYTIVSCPRNVIPSVFR